MFAMATSVFVARNEELNRLKSYMYEAFDKDDPKLQICFVTGQSGSGKSTLLNEFAREAQATDDGIFVAFGNCDTIRGINDPYLPFKEILSYMVGSVGSKSVSITAKDRIKNALRTTAQGFVEVAPDLVGTLIPFSSLIVSLGLFGIKNLGGLKFLEKRAKEPENNLLAINPTNIFQQYANLLHFFTNKHPLILILDDFQRADSESISLLFNLVSKLSKTRIMIICSHRPTEIVTETEGNHPLDEVRNEIMKVSGNVSIDLDVAQIKKGQKFVDEYIEAAYGIKNPNFSATLFERTGGLPFFVEHILNDMKDQNIIQIANGNWAISDNLNWQNVPDKVNAVIKSYMSRLGRDLQRILQTSSVQGIRFNVDIVSKMLDISKVDLLHTLHDIEQNHRLLQEGDKIIIGNSRFSQYFFTHSIIQEYIYQSLGGGEKRELHLKTAELVKTLHAEHLNEALPQLIWHYSQAEEIEKAVIYSCQLVEQNLNVGIYQEVENLINSTLSLLQEANLISATVYVAKLQRLLGQKYFHLGEYERAKDTLNNIQDLSDEREKALVNLLLGKIARSEHKLAEATRYLQLSLKMFESLDDLNYTGFVLRELGVVLGRAGYSVGLGYHKQALDIFRRTDNIIGQIQALNSIGYGSMRQGELEVAKESLLKALDLAKQSKLDKVFVLNNLGIVYRLYGEFQSAHDCHNQAIAISENENTESNVLKADSYGDSGTTYLYEGPYDEAVDRFKQALEMGLNSRSIHINSQYLARAYLFRGELEQAYDTILQAGAIDIVSHNHITAFVWGLILALRGQMDNAVEMFKKALSESEKLLLRTGRLSDPKYTKMLALAALALFSTSVEDQKTMLKRCEEAALAALEGCNAKGVVVENRRLMEKLMLLDNDQILQPTLNLLS